MLLHTAFSVAVPNQLHTSDVHHCFARDGDYDITMGDLFAKYLVIDARVSGESPYFDNQMRDEIKGSDTSGSGSAGVPVSQPGFFSGLGLGRTATSTSTSIYTIEEERLSDMATSLSMRVSMVEPSARINSWHTTLLESYQEKAAAEDDDHRSVSDASEFKKLEEGFMTIGVETKTKSKSAFR